jgi:hypothetical protein
MTRALVFEVQRVVLALVGESWSSASCRRWCRCLSDSYTPATSPSQTRTRASPSRSSAFRVISSDSQAASRDRPVVGFSVTLTGPPISVPPALSSLLATLPTQGSEVVPLIGPDGSDPTWLFPGRAAGRHIAPAAISARLAHHDIHARPSRNAALIALAGDLPVAVLGDLLDLSIAAAIRWTRHAARDWHGYIAAVREDPDHSDARPDPTDDLARLR